MVHNQLKLVHMEGEIAKIKTEHDRMKNDIEDIIKRLDLHLDFCLQNIGHYQQKKWKISISIYLVFPFIILFEILDVQDG